MDIDEYDYVEKNLENVDPQNKVGIDKDAVVTPKPDEVKVWKRSSKHKTDVKADDLARLSKRSRSRDESPDHGTKRGSSRRCRLSPTYGGRSIDKNGHKSGREHKDNINKHRDREEGNGRDRVRDQDRDKMRGRDRDRHRESDRDRDRDRDHARGKDREPDRSHRSRSQSVRCGDERVEEKSRDWEHVERKSGKDYKERVRDIRPHKDRKEEVVEEVDPERDRRTVFAYQITLKANERDVFEFFSRAGKVRDVRLITDRISNRSKGVGYVEFVDAMSVPMAIALSGQPLLGQSVMVKLSEAEKNLVQPTSSTGGAIDGTLGPYSGGARRLYVGNLHLNMKDDQLRQVFEPFGAVEMVQLPTEPETGRCKGFGFVQFARLEDATAAESLNGQLEIAGHLIKVSAVTDQPLLQAGVKKGDFDDDEGGGLTLNGSSRTLLMQKLDRSGTWLRLQASISDLPIPPVTVPSFDLIGVPSECLLLKNMFDPKHETKPDFELDIKEDVEEECSKFGTLRHIYVDKLSRISSSELDIVSIPNNRICYMYSIFWVSAGFVYLRFEITQAAMSAQRTLHGRWFAGKMITATFMVLQNYEATFPDSR